MNAAKNPEHDQDQRKGPGHAAEPEPVKMIVVVMLSPDSYWNRVLTRLICAAKEAAVFSDSSPPRGRMQIEGNNTPQAINCRRAVDPDQGRCSKR